MCAPYQTTMRFRDGGRAQSAAVVVALAAAVAVVAVAGIAFGAMDSTSDERTAEEILSDIETTYTDADSVVTDAVVTVEVDNRTAEFEVSTATAGDDQVRVNVSGGDRSVVTGLDGETLWLSESTTGLTGVIEKNGTAATASLRADTSGSGFGLSALPDDIGLDTELLALLDAVEGDRPTELDGLPANVTIGELLAGETGPDLGGILPATGGQDSPGPGVFGDFNGTLPVPDEFGEFNGTFPAPGEYGAYNWTELRERLDESLAGEFDRPEVTVERVGTTTVDGTEANELLLSSPDIEGETRLWVDAETDVVLRQETTLPGLTTTVDVRETRFDVSPGDSTFQPPGATEVASLTAAVGETPGEFASAAPFETATPAEAWTFERGLALSGEAPALTDLPGIEQTAVAAGAYTDNNDTLLVGQVDRAVDLSVIPTFVTETVTVDGREVRLLSGQDGTVGVFTENETTVVVASTVDESRFREIIDGIEF